MQKLLRYFSTAILIAPLLVFAAQQGPVTSGYSGWPYTIFSDKPASRYLPEGVSLYARDWIRVSDFHYFDPGVTGADPDYGYLSNRFRFGIKVKHRKWIAESSLQYVKQAYLPDDASGNPGGPLGVGAAYFASNRSRAPASLYIKYLNVSLLDIANSGISVTAGRFDYGSGVETLSGIKRIDWLKTSRVDARLLGSFGWSIYQRSFDGFKFAWEHKLGHLSVAGFRPTQGGFESNANEEISQIDVLATAYTFKPGKPIPDSEIQLFHYYFKDRRKVSARADNSGLTTPSGRQDLALNTFGGHFAAAKSLGAGMADLLIWGAYQTGDWFGQHHRASGLAIEAGYQLLTFPWKPWIRLGAYHGSGDGDPNDNTHGTFYQMLPTVRKYSFTTTTNLMNNRDYFVQLFLSPLTSLKLQFDVHRLQLSESADLWYGGAGATKAHGSIQGFAGHPSGGATDLGTSLEFTAKYRLSKGIGLHAFYGHVFGDDVIGNNFRKSENLDFFYFEMALDF